MIQLQAAASPSQPGRPGTLLLDLFSGKKQKCAAFVPGAILPGIDLSQLEPDKPTPMVVPLMKEGRKGLEKVGELQLSLNFALIDQ